jgi:hypothetical protein
MAGNLGELVQMITALSGVQAQKEKLRLDEQQLSQQASQFAQQGEEQNFANALKLIAGSSAKTRQGLEGLLNTLAPHHREAAMAYLQGQPTDPQVLHAQDIEAGRSTMSPQQLAAVQNESATQNATGMNVGALGASQLGGTLAAGAIPQVTPAMAGAYAERAASGRSPVEAAVQAQQMASGAIPFMAKAQAGQVMTAPQQAQIGLGYANVAVAKEGNRLQWANLEQDERKMAADYGLRKIMAEADAMKAAGGAGGAAGGLTGAAWLDGMQKLPQILNDINKNTSDKAGNMARINVYNTLAHSLGQDHLIIPYSGEGAPGKVSTFQQFTRGLGINRPGIENTPGASAPSAMPWPTMTPTLPAPR